MTVIELRELKKSYGNVKALDGLNLEVPSGVLYGLLGPNGAGKTTALRVISTLIAPDSGIVRVAGLDALKQARAVRSRLGYVAQEVAIDKILTGRELLRLQAALYHLPTSDLAKRIEWVIESLDMKLWIDRRCGTYSGGMRRRLDLASGLLHQPQLLVLDEPTVGLDIESRSAIWKLLRDLIGQGTTVLLSSHYLEEVEALADRMAILDEGRVIAEGTPSQLKKELGGDRITLRIREFSNEAESEEVRQLIQKVEGVRQVVVNKSQGFSLNLVVDGDEVISLLRAQLSAAQLPVFAITQSKPSLDDVYLQATGRTLMDAELAVAGKRDIKLESKKSMR